MSYKDGLTAFIVGPIRFDGPETPDRPNLQIRNRLLATQILLVKGKVDLILAAFCHCFSPWSFAQTFLFMALYIDLYPNSNSPGPIPNPENPLPPGCLNKVA